MELLIVVLSGSGGAFGKCILIFFLVVLMVLLPVLAGAGLLRTLLDEPTDRVLEA